MIKATFTRDEEDQIGIDIEVQANKAEIFVTIEALVNMVAQDDQCHPANVIHMVANTMMEREAQKIEESE